MSTTDWSERAAALLGAEELDLAAVDAFAAAAVKQASSMDRATVQAVSDAVDALVARVQRDQVAVTGRARDLTLGKKKLGGYGALKATNRPQRVTRRV